MEISYQFTIKDFAAKCKSKAGFYNLQPQRVQCIFPPIQDSTYAYLRGIMMGQKEYVKSKNIMVIKVLAIKLNCFEITEIC